MAWTPTGRWIGALLLSAALLGSGCGYRLTHPAGGLSASGGRACAPLMENLTPEPAAETWFTEALRTHLLRLGALARGGCQTELVGTIVSLQTGVGAVDSNGRLVSYRSRATLKLTLREGGAEVRSVQVSGIEESLAGLDVVGAETAREAAYRRLAEQLARDAVERLALLDG